MSCKPEDDYERLRRMFEEEAKKPRGNSKSWLIMGTIWAVGALFLVWLCALPR